MSSSARIIAIVGTVIVLVVAFVVLRPGDDEPDAPVASTPTTAAAPPPLGDGHDRTTPAATTSTAQPPPPPPPPFSTIVVRGGKPVGGVKRIEVTKGERARIEVTSSDTSDEIHLHGYDISRDLRAGGRVRLSFTADADGIYEIELENAGVPIGELVVSPG